MQGCCTELQGWANPQTPGSKNKRIKSWFLLPAAGRRTQLFHLIFKEPGVCGFADPCTVSEIGMTTLELWGVTDQNNDSASISLFFATVYLISEVGWGMKNSCVLTSSLFQIYMGACTYYVCYFFGIFDLLPPCQYQIYTDSFPSLRNWLTSPPPQSQCHVHAS